MTHLENTMKHQIFYYDTVTGALVKIVVAQFRSKIDCSFCFDTLQKYHSRELFIEPAADNA